MIKKQCRLAFTRGYSQCMTVKIQFYKYMNVRSLIASNMVKVKHGIRGGVFSTYFNHRWNTDSTRVVVSTHYKYDVERKIIVKFISVNIN